MIRKKGYEMKDYAAWLKAWETYNLHFYSVPAWLILALVFSLIAGIAFAVARGLAKKEQPDRPGLLVNAMLVVSLAAALLISLLTSLSGLIFVPLLLGAVWLKYKVGRMDGEAWEHYFQSVSTVGLLLRGGVLLLLALGLTALLSWPLFALLGFPMPERLALLFFLIGGADLFRKLSQERDELVRKLLRLKLPGGRKGVTEQ